jgi:tRNA pseudouridine55 synthase
VGRRKNKGRNVSGVLLLDKPQGCSSNHILQKVKRLFGAAKAGHTGSLDPLATGMLPVCFGEATKISAFLLDSDKRYHVKCQLGVSTATGDAEGEVTETQDASFITGQDVKAVLPAFIGEIAQIPPMYSALKHNGERLYKLARQGIEVERKPRNVTIYDIKYISLSINDLPENDQPINNQKRVILELEVSCSKGTYVRTLVEDIAKKLNSCAHITALRRLSVGPYDGDMLTIEQLSAYAEQGTDVLDACLQPIDSGVADWPDVHLGSDAAFYVRQGQAVMVPHAPTQGWVRIYDQSQFLGLGEIQDDGMVAPRRMIKQCA